MNEFYVGYLPEAPQGIRRRVRATVTFLFVLAAAGAIVFARMQRTYAPSTFEYQNATEFTGVIEAIPFPSLLVNRPGQTSASEAFSSYLLVAPGKHGADSHVAPFAGKTVKLSGKLLYQGTSTMIEIVPNSISEAASTGSPATERERRGPFELTGEIVDSKCYLGAMNPGNGKVHKDCAVRCVSGGIPPALITKDLAASPTLVLLIDPNGRALPKEQLIDLMARPVRIRGELYKSSDTFYLQVGPGAISALP